MLYSAAALWTVDAHVYALIELVLASDHGALAISHKCFLVQDKITEVRVQAERALANAMQQHAAAAGMSDWAGQVIDAAGDWWFGGFELKSLGPNATTIASMQVEQMEAGLERVVVRSLPKMCCATSA
jgi:hypothetical protein